MKKVVKLLLILLVVPMIFMTSCKKDPVKKEFETLSTYMADNNLDLSKILFGADGDNKWVTSGGGININDADYSVPDFYVIDLRSATDFDAGHIKDAHNTTLGGILEEAAKAGKTAKILVVCYTGQTAARGVSALRMMGYTKAKSLKWGMSCWHSDFQGKWDSNVGDTESPNWVTTGEPAANKEFDDPSFTTGESAGADILEKRVRAMLAADWKVSKTDLLASPSSYFINNKWTLDSWNAFGHIDGAYRIDETLNLAGLKNLDPGAVMVTYCYTGQTSSISSAWLYVMGYNAKSLLFGANGLVHTALLGSSKSGVTWKGTGSGSAMNYGYYNTAGDYFPPN